MKIKGHAKVELIDAENGKVKRTIEQDNTVTNFATEFFKNCGMLRPGFPFTWERPKAIDELFGGIMLFNEEVTQNYDPIGGDTPIYCPAGVEMVGNCTIQHNFVQTDVATPQFGVYLHETSEDPENTNDTKRTFVYEWRAGKGVGTIKSICLTSRPGGYIGTGQEVKFNSEANRYEAYFDYSKWNPKLHYFSTINSDNLLKYRKIKGTTPAGGNNYSIAQRFCSVELDKGELIYLDSTPESVFNNNSTGEITLKWYNLPIKKMDPFLDILDFDPDKNVVTNSETFTINNLPLNANNLVNRALIASGVGYIIIMGVYTANYTIVDGQWKWVDTNNKYVTQIDDTTYYAGNTLHVIKIYKNELGNWTGDYHCYENLTFPYLNSPYGTKLYTRIAFNGYLSGTSPDSGQFNFKYGYLLDNIPGPYHNSLVIGGLTWAYQGGSSNPTYDNYYVIKPSGEAELLAVKPTSYPASGDNVASVINPINSNSISLNSVQNELMYACNGKIIIKDRYCWDPILNKYYYYNSDLSWNNGWHNCFAFDSYNFINYNYKYSRIDLPYSSPLSASYMPCNWLSTIANLGEEGINKRDDETLRITYTLTFEEEA